jgi:hypothetical protein
MLGEERERFGLVVSSNLGCGMRFPILFNPSKPRATKFTEMYIIGLLGRGLEFFLMGHLWVPDRLVECASHQFGKD